MGGAKKQIISHPLRVLGIDPGTATVGWAIIEENAGILVPVAFGHISTPKNNSEENRLAEISEDLVNIIEKYHPREAAVEQLFFFKNKKTIISVGQSRGGILLTLEQKGVKIASYSPLQVKQAVTGYGKAEKKQVQLMVKSILGLKAVPKPDDTADALAIAICHINSRKVNNF
ncbi:MAG: crossover junction endodeoxyribonuclease RuvC [bacterium]|nr:crossover junction endodeoxyribonuclease RuvC [bacterium]